ncbi:MAG: dipeptide epimerase [Thermoplasmata archaeon]
MRLLSLRTYQVIIPLVRPFVISTGVQRYYEGVFLRLRASGGLEGWGEAVPSRRVTGETPSGVIAELSRAAEKILRLDPLETGASLEFAAQWIKGPSALAALDIALHDLKGKYYGVPVRHLFGGMRRGIETSVTISIGTGEETLRRAEELIRRGFRILKVKLGRDPESDVARVRRLRSWLGGGVRIRVDANQGYTASQAIDVLRRIHGCDIEFCEQPVPANALRALARVRKSSPVPIMADESVRYPAELLRVIKADAADMVNLKLMKSGGLRRAFQMARICEAAGMPCQMGCMIETKLGITAATHLALADSSIAYADLDGHLELASDPCRGGVRTARGENSVPAHPGLGLGIVAPN